MTHYDNTKIGVLLVNLGTPATPSVREVRKFLKEFLADPRVVEIPRWLWQPLLNCLILPLRSHSSAKLYQKIWTPQGSPLLYFAQRQASALQAALNQVTSGSSIKVVLGMSYGRPAIASALAELRVLNLQQLIVLPLYPQYSSATVGSVFTAVSQILKTWRYLPKLQMINHYADHPGYVAAVVNSIKNYWQENPPGEKLLFSFHGLPARSITAGDPYFYQCHRTAELLAQQLQLPADRWQVVFQSRLGWQKWLQPYCDQTLRDFASQGIAGVDVVCPGFAADCLETLEEINIRNKKLFLLAGGKKFNYIPALNDSPEHIDVLTDLIMREIRI